MIYKLYTTLGSDIANAAMTIGIEPQVSFVFDPANTDYANFKIQVAGGTSLEDPEGVLMTQEQVDDFLKTIP